MASASGWPEPCAGACRLSEGEGLAAGLQGGERLLAALLLFDPEGAHEVGHALAEPGAGRLHPGMGEGVGHDAFQLLGRRVVQAGGQQRAGLKRGVLAIGQVEQGELGARALAQPALAETA